MNELERYVTHLYLLLLFPLLPLTLAPLVLLALPALSAGRYRLEACFDSGCYGQVLNLSAADDASGDAVDVVYAGLADLQRGGPELWFRAVQRLARHQHEVPLAAEVLANRAGQ